MLDVKPPGKLHGSFRGGENKLLDLHRQGQRGAKLEGASMSRLSSSQDPEWGDLELVKGSAPHIQHHFSSAAEKLGMDTRNSFLLKKKKTVLGQKAQGLEQPLCRLMVLVSDTVLCP